MAPSKKSSADKSKSGAKKKMTPAAGRRRKSLPPVVPDQVEPVVATPPAADQQAAPLEAKPAVAVSSAETASRARAPAASREGAKAEGMGDKSVETVAAPTRPQVASPGPGATPPPDSLLGRQPYATVFVAIAALILLQIAAYWLTVRPVTSENASLRAEIESLDERIAVLSDSTDRISSEAQRIGGQVSDIEDVIRRAAATARVAELVVLQAALASGLPFGEQLTRIEATQTLRDDASALLDELRPYAMRGTATVAELRANFDSLPEFVAEGDELSWIPTSMASFYDVGADVVDAVSHRAEETMVVAGRWATNGRKTLSEWVAATISPDFGATIAPSNAAPAVTVEATPPPPPSTPTPSLDAEIQSLLDSGDVAAASARLAGATDSPDRPTQDWLAAASARLAADHAVAALTAEIAAVRESAGYQ